MILQLKHFANLGADFNDASRLADMAAFLTSASDAAMQDILEQLSVPDRSVCLLVDLGVFKDGLPVYVLFVTHS